MYNLNELYKATFADRGLHRTPDYAALLIQNAPRVSGSVFIPEILLPAKYGVLVQFHSYRFWTMTKLS